MASIGDRRISFTVTAYGVNGKAINHGNLWCTCYTIEDARDHAQRWFRQNNGVDPQIGSVIISGGEYKLDYDCWRRTGEHSTYERIVSDEPIRYSKSDLTLRCYDTTVMDYFETVHPRRADGTCQCGDPTRNTPL